MDNAVLWKLTYGMYSVGALDGERPCGCIINTVEQVTAVPEQFVMSMSKENYTHELIVKAGVFSVSVLSEQTTALVIASLGFQSGRERDKYKNVAYKRLPSGLPIVDENCCGYLECKVTGSMDFGTHTVFAAIATDYGVLSDQKPMTYAYYHDVVKGRAPKNAPTHLPHP